MPNVVIACDKFKGSLTADEACSFINKGILSIARSETTCVLHPMADGGEGSLDVISKYITMNKTSVELQDPLGRIITAWYGVHHEEAFIETSAACGLQLLHPSEYHPMKTNTYGVGQMIADAMARGSKKIHLFVGGSSTTDGGTGMASALGYIFKDENNHSFVPAGGTLSKIKKIVSTRKNRQIDNVLFYVWTDVDILLFGPLGAAYMFARQKGALEGEIKHLDSGLRHMVEIYADVAAQKEIADIHGSGAAGGLAAGCVAFLNAQLGSGINYIIEKTDISSKILQADLVITGEGSIDDQSLKGKVVSGIANLCLQNNKKLILAGGMISLSEENLHLLAPVKTYTIQTEGMSLDYAIKHAGERLYDIGREIGKRL